MNVYIWNDTWLPGSNTLVYLPLNGDANDSSGNGNNGTVSSNSGSYSWQYISGSSGRKCFYSTLGTTTAEVAGGVVSGTYSSSAIRSNPRTISVWFKTTGQTTSVSFHWIGNRSGSTQGEWFGLYCGNGNKFGVLRYYSDPYIIKSSFDSNWHNYVVAYDDTNKSKLYIDGVLQTFSGNGTVTFDTLGTAYQLGILRAYNGSLTTNVYFSEYIIESTVWTADQVAGYYNQTKSLYGIS